MQVHNSYFSAFVKSTGTEHVFPLALNNLQIAEKIQNYPPAWYFIYLFLLIGILAWIRIYYGNILTQTLQASVNFKLASKMFNNNSQLQNQLDGVLYLYYFLSVAFLLYHIELKTGFFPYGLQGGLLFLFNFALLSSVFLGKVVLHNIAGILFNRVRLVREYLYNMFIFNKLAGLVALPLVFLLVYTESLTQEILFWITVVVLSSLVVMRVIRAVIYSYRKEVLIFYMFLYLCALEITPLVLLYRWLEGIL